MKYQFLLDATNDYTKLYIIANEQKIVYTQKYLNAKNLSINLTTYVETCFKELKLTYTNFNKIFLVYGPGKFSAMRICSVFVKTWAIMFNPQIYLIDKFDYIAKTSECFSIVESDGQKYFVVQYKNWQKLGIPQLIDTIALNELLLKHSSINRFYDTSNELIDLATTLAKFKQVERNFELIYLKNPC